MAEKCIASVNQLSLSHGCGTYSSSTLLTRLLLRRRAQERDSRRSELRGCLTTGRRRAPHSSSPIRPVPTLIRPPALPSPPLFVICLSVEDPKTFDVQRLTIKDHYKINRIRVSR